MTNSKSRLRPVGILLTKSLSTVASLPPQARIGIALGFIPAAVAFIFVMTIMTIERASSPMALEKDRPRRQAVAAIEGFVSTLKQTGLNWSEVTQKAINTQLPIITHSLNPTQCLGQMIFAIGELDTAMAVDNLDNPSRPGTANLATTERRWISALTETFSRYGQCSSPVRSIAP